MYDYKLEEFLQLNRHLSKSLLCDLKAESRYLTKTLKRKREFFKESLKEFSDIKRYAAKRRVSVTLELSKRGKAEYALKQLLLNT